LEATSLCHGREEAQEASKAAAQLFGGDKSAFSDSVPCYRLSSEEVQKGLMAYLLFEKTGLCRTRGEARRLISQGGGYVNDRRIEAYDQIIDFGDSRNDVIILRAGKKRYLKIDIG
jgi:tyrosyl-tRNA synthetase